MNTNENNNNDDNDGNDYEFSIEVNVKYLPAILSYLNEIFQLQRLEQEWQEINQRILTLEAQKLIAEVQEDLWKYEQE